MTVSIPKKIKERFLDEILNERKMPLPERLNESILKELSTL